MSSLIILPGQEAVSDTESLVGHVLMLDTTKQRRFQCFGFVVTPNIPVATVEANAQQAPLRKALADKILIDITSDRKGPGSDAASKLISDIDKAVKAKTLSVVKEKEAEEFPVFTGKDSKGNTYVITPKDRADYERMQDEIATTGSLRIPKPKPEPSEFRGFPALGGLSPIVVEDLPTRAPVHTED